MYKIFTRLCHRTVKVLRNTEAEAQQEEGATIAQYPHAQFPRVKGQVYQLPPGPRLLNRRATETTTPTPADPGTHMESTWSAKKGEIKEKGMVTEPSPSETKE
jgi:hypothetical protein